jgi:hypothetical protein
MRLKGIVLATLIAGALIASCSSISFKPLFDLSSWTTDTYPAFGPSGSLFNAMAPRMPSASFGGVSLQDIKYMPIFDMSPDSFSFNAYPAFTGLPASQGSIFGMMSGILSRSV